MKTYNVTINFVNGNSETINSFNSLSEAISLFDKTNVPTNTDIEADEIEIKKFNNEEIEEFNSNEVPASHVQFVTTGWFVKQ